MPSRVSSPSERTIRAFAIASTSAEGVMPSWRSRLASYDTDTPSSAVPRRSTPDTPSTALTRGITRSSAIRVSAPGV